MDLRLMLRIIAPTLGVAALLLILGGLAAWYVHRLQKESAILLSTTVEEITAAEELLMISHDIRNLLAEHTANEAGDHLQMVRDRQQQANQWLAQCAELTGSSQEQELVERIAQGFEEFHSAFSAIAESNTDTARIEYAALGHEVNQQILAPVKEYRALVNQQMRQSANRDELLADRMGIGLFVLGMCGAVAGLVAGFGFARSIHRSLIQVSVPVHDAAGKLNEVVGPINVSAETLGDLEKTMQIVAERVGTVVHRLQQSQEAAQRSEQLASLGQLAAGIAHELRNPLTSMKIIVQTAADQDDGTSLDSRDLAVLTEEITRLENRIQSFLDYARPPRPVKRPFILRESLKQTIDFVSLRARQMGIKIEYAFPEEIVQLNADAGQLREVLLNLLLNAIDASPENATVCVRLTFESMPDGPGSHLRDAEESGWMRIDVEDEGDGLPPDVEEKIFEPFISTKESGTGLGLPICKRIVEDHGGQITAANRSGGGAVFSVRLPLTSQELQ